MKIHEFQAKQLLAGYGLPSPEGAVAITPEQAEQIARQIGSPRIAVKAQILAGGRSQARGVRIVDSPVQAKAAAQELLGRRLITAQTGPEGQLVKRVYVEAGVSAARELHLALLIDRTSGELMVIGSAAGGADIEERVRQGGLQLETLLLGTGDAPRDAEVAAFVSRLGLEGELHVSACALIDSLRRAFVELDASLIEINPLAISEAASFMALDAKMILDDNALFRHPDLEALRDVDEIDVIELQAQRHQLNYVRLDGNIGIAVNGAGLGLATLDMVREANGRPANFMDIRTTATSLDVAHGFGLLLDNPATRAILINVHGGGMQPCDTIADGLGIAMRRTGRSLPVITRLAGNNADFARSRFKNFGCSIIDCPDMWTAAKTAVSIATRGA